MHFHVNKVGNLWKYFKKEIKALEIRAHNYVKESKEVYILRVSLCESFKLIKLLVGIETTIQWWALAGSHRLFK